MAVSESVMRHLHKAQAGDGTRARNTCHVPARTRAPPASLHDHLRRRPPDRARAPLRGPRARRRSPNARRTWSRSTAAARRGSTKTPSTRRSASTRSPAGRRPSGAWSRRASTRCGAAVTTSKRGCTTWTSTASTPPLCFPSLIAGFAGTIFAASKDPELGLACLRAWNDWHIEEWAGPHPDRIIPLQLAWLPDPEIAAADVRRNAARGFKAVSFPENPVDLELPSVHTDHWDPFLRARAKRRKPSSACTTARRRGPRPGRRARRSSCTPRCSP